MRNAIVIPGLMLLLALCACTSTVSREELKQRAARYDLTSWPDTTYYCGSRAGYDYFLIEPSGPSTVTRGRKWRVPVADGAVADRFVYTADRQHWRVVKGGLTNGLSQ